MLQPWGSCQPPVLGDDSGSRRNITGIRGECAQSQRQPQGRSVLRWQTKQVTLC